MATTSQRRRPNGAGPRWALPPGHGPGLAPCWPAARELAVQLLQRERLGAAIAAAKIAREAAAEAPVIVVMQGIPWRTAACGSRSRRSGRRSRSGC